MDLHAVPVPVAGLTDGSSHEDSHGLSTSSRTSRALSERVHRLVSFAGLAVQGLHGGGVLPVLFAHSNRLGTRIPRLIIAFVL